ncbi:MAG: hypothetical protein ACYTAO_19670 [Planctomycetota bacterium]|jgi:uncharacterized membrane protein YqjE
MNAVNAIVGFLCIVTVAVLAIYWTLWKVRAELNENLQKMASELAEVRKALEKKAGGT